MNCHLLKTSDKQRLDFFVAQHPHGSIEQSWDWGALQTCIPGRPHFYVWGLEEKGKLVASMLVIRQVMGLGKTWLWCPGGPLLPEGRREEAWMILRKACEDYARKAGDVFLRIEPFWPENLNFDLGGSFAKESYLPRNTLQLDLSLSEENLLKQMTQKGRYHIKQAEKAGVRVRKGHCDDLSLFYTLLTHTSERDGFSVHQKDFYKDFLGILHERAHFYLAFFAEELLAGMLVTHFGNTATYYYGASSHFHREMKASYLLQWYAIIEARKAGLKVYDFLGIAPEGIKNHPWEGVTQFKTRFGGSRTAYTPAQVLVFRPFWWALYKLAKKL